MTTAELIPITQDAAYKVVDIDVSNGPVSLRLTGDIASATITLYIPKVRLPDPTDAVDWMKYQSGGTDVTITSSDNLLVINYPCVIRFVKPSSASHPYGLCMDICSKYT
jgi:hypothetical protein